VGARLRSESRSPAMVWRQVCAVVYKYTLAGRAPCCPRSSRSLLLLSLMASSTPMFQLYQDEEHSVGEGGRQAPLKASQPRWAKQSSKNSRIRRLVLSFGALVTIYLMFCAWFAYARGEVCPPPSAHLRLDINHLTGLRLLPWTFRRGLSSWQASLAIPEASSSQSSSSPKIPSSSSQSIGLHSSSYSNLSLSVDQRRARRHHPRPQGCHSP
jgi:hypothetical protein